MQWLPASAPRCGPTDTTAQHSVPFLRAKAIRCIQKQIVERKFVRETMKLDYLFCIVLVL
jgi:hypothetical protein